MSKLTESFKTVGVCNPANFANGEPYLNYYPLASYGHYSQDWVCHKSGENLSGHIIYHGKSFSTFGSGPHHELKRRALEAAKAWAGERFGITEWARTPYGSWMDADFVKRRTAELKAMVEAKEAEGTE